MDTLVAVSVLFLLVVGFVFMIVYFVMKTRDVVRKTGEFFSDAPVQARHDDEPVVQSKLGQRLLGLLIVLGGGYAAHHVWNEVNLTKEFGLKSAFLLPFVITLGLGVIAFPVDAYAQKWKYGAARPRNWKEMPAGMKLTLVLSLCAGIGACYTLYRMGFHPN